MLVLALQFSRSAHTTWRLRWSMWWPMPSTHRGSGARRIDVARAGCGGRLPQNGREDKIGRHRRVKRVNLPLTCVWRPIR